MTYIPGRIIALDKEDLEKEKEEFLKWSSGKDYGVEFLTVDEAIAKGIDLKYDSNESYPTNQFSEKAKTRLQDAVQNYLIIDQHGDESKLDKEFKRWAEGNNHVYQCLTIDELKELGLNEDDKKVMHIDDFNHQLREGRGKHKRFQKANAQSKTKAKNKRRKKNKNKKTHRK